MTEPKMPNGRRWRVLVEGEELIAYVHPKRRLLASVSVEHRDGASYHVVGVSKMGQLCADSELDFVEIAFGMQGAQEVRDDSNTRYLFKEAQ